jgi:hypothetical protein
MDIILGEYTKMLWIISSGKGKTGIDQKLLADVLSKAILMRHQYIFTFLVVNLKIDLSQNVKMQDGKMTTFLIMAMATDILHL